MPPVGTQNIKRKMDKGGPQDNFIDSTPKGRLLCLTILFEFYIFA